MKKTVLKLVIALLIPALFLNCEKKKNAAQELVIGEQFDLKSIDPADNMLDDAQILVYNGLVEIDSEFRQTPGLAESWEMSGDGLTWTFKLRQNVRFHDGAAWNAQAALANFKRLDGYPGLADTEKVETPDDSTLVFHMKKPAYNLSSNLARTMMSMVSPASINPDGSLSGEAGSGPYKLVSWDKESEFVFEAFDDFWGGKPNIRKITFKIIPDAEARILALEAGEVDMISGYQSLAAVKSLINDKRFQIIKKTQNTSEMMLFNMRRPPLDDINIRMAIGHALDFNAMVSNLLAGLASPPSGFFSPAYGDLVNPAVKNPAYNPAAAMSLLDEALWVAGNDGIRVKNGKRLELTLTYNAANTEDSLLAPVIQDALKNAGIALMLNPVDGGALDSAEENKTYDMLLTGQSFIPTDDPSFHYERGYWHSNSYYHVYSEDNLDAMIDELAITMDGAKRKELHWAIQKQIMDNAPLLMVFHRNSIRIAKANIRNFDISAGCWHINRAIKDCIIE